MVFLMLLVLLLLLRKRRTRLESKSISRPNRRGWCSLATRQPLQHHNTTLSTYTTGNPAKAIAISSSGYSKLRNLPAW